MINVLLIYQNRESFWETNLKVIFREPLARHCSHCSFLCFWVNLNSGNIHLISSCGNTETIRNYQFLWYTKKLSKWKFLGHNICLCGFSTTSQSSISFWIAYEILLGAIRGLPNILSSFFFAHLLLTRWLESLK